jgi:hypothetical protein
MKSRAVKTMSRGGCFALALGDSIETAARLKIVEYWANADSLLFVQQLGLSEVPGTTPAH